MKQLIYFAVIWQVLNCSAYCHSGNRTASGVWPAVGMCAADHLPFGSRVTLPDGIQLVVADRFGAGHHNHLDIWMASEAACWNFGRRGFKCRIQMP